LTRKEDTAMRSARRSLTISERRKLHILKTALRSGSTVGRAKSPSPSDSSRSCTPKYDQVVLVALAVILGIFLIYALREIQFPHITKILTLDFWAPMR
jgi:hypothetical protein